MNFGVVLPVEGPKATRESIVANARLAEELGFHSVWATDRILIPRAAPSGYPYSQARGAVAFRADRRWLEPITTLSFAAAVTDTVMLGTNVLVLPYRQPFVLAQEVASLDHLSGGRLLLGVGVGWMREEFHALGIDPSTRGARTDEWITLMRELWSDRHAFALPAGGGRTVAPPILIGGNSAAAFRRVARLGDGWVGVDLDPVETEVATAAIIHEATRRGRRREELLLSMRRRIEAEDMASSLSSVIDDLVADVPAYAGASVDLIVVDLLMTPNMPDALAQLADSLIAHGWLAERGAVVASE